MPIFPNKVFYDKAIQEFGVTHKGLHWNSKYNQYIRFEMLTKFIKKDIKRSSIVDVGCGFGDYITFLELDQKLPTKYIGIDCEEKMIKVSKEKFPNYTFKKIDVLKDELFEADYFVASGSLNILNIDECELFIKKCYTSSKKGFVFNFLKNITFNKISQKDILNICTKYCSKVRLKENYLDNDFTILMIK